MVKLADKEGIPLISNQDMEQRELQYQQRIHDVTNSCNLIMEATTQHEELAEEQRLRDHWEHYLRCDGLPRPYLPTEMRTFMSEKRHYQQLAYDRRIDWTLSVDERSILSQDIFRIDKTRNSMKQKLDDQIGKFFERDISMYLQTLISIDSMLENATEMSRVDADFQMEIMEVRSEMQQEIDQSFDRLSYRIIRMDRVYMDSKDDVVATWGYSCDHHDMDIWGLRNVPIRFAQMPAPLLVADLPHAKVTVQLPLSVLHDCLTLRCIHSRFDHYSQYAKSFDPIIPEDFKERTAGILNISDCLVGEWFMQLDLQEELLLGMLQKREAYEETMRYIAERIEKADKERKANQGGEKVKTITIPKAPKEPQLVPPGMVPDAYDSFLVREQQQYEEILADIFHPSNLQMKRDEINLRQYLILGGLYAISFLHRPLNTHFEKFNLILHEDGRMLKVMEDVVAELQPMRPSSLHARHSRPSRMLLDQDAKQRKSLKFDDGDLPYFFVKLQLPEDLCRWGDPIPCQFITEMEVIEPEPDTKSEDRFESQLLERSQQKKKRVKPDSVKIRDEVVEINLPDLSRISPRATGSINVFRPTLIAQLRQSKRSLTLQWKVPLRNFPLEKQLTQPEIRSLERYAVPRVISSFKFPVEIIEDQREQHAKKSEAKKLVTRLRSIDKEDSFDYSHIEIGFEDQDAPERIFPVFAGVESVLYHPDDINEDYPKKTMYGLLNTLDDIDSAYISKHAAIMQQTDFKVKSKGKKMESASSILKQHRQSTKARTVSKLSIRQTLAGSGPSSRLGSVAHDEEAKLGELDTTGSGASNGSSSNSDEQQEKEEELPREKVTHWTTKHILSHEFDRKGHTMTIKTDRLGIFGLAFKRYEHFPFRNWSMRPNEENPDEIIFNLDTFHCRVVLHISTAGVRGYVTDLSVGYVAKPVKYLNIEEPVSDFRVLRQLFYDKSINLFAEHDASFYIDNGYFSVKHVAMEDHIYDAMALHCKTMKFSRSDWNRLASRRNILLCMKNAKDASDLSEVTMRITPDTATFVEVTELCSDDLNVIKLDFLKTWRNLGNYTDLHQAIVSMHSQAIDMMNKDALLLFYLKRLLSEFHIMSYS